MRSAPAIHAAVGKWLEVGAGVSLSASQRLSTGACILMPIEGNAPESPRKSTIYYCAFRLRFLTAESGESQVGPYIRPGESMPMSGVLVPGDQALAPGASAPQPAHAIYLESDGSTCFSMDTIRPRAAPSPWQALRRQNPR